MNALVQAFPWLLANAASSTLARQVLNLKAENRILRARLPGKVTVTPQERQTLVRDGKPVGAALKELISIVTPRTFLRWLYDEKKPRKAKRPAKPGRPRTAEELRETARTAPSMACSLWPGPTPSAASSTTRRYNGRAVKPTLQADVEAPRRCS